CFFARLRFVSAGAGVLLLLNKVLKKPRSFKKAPPGDPPPPMWIRAILFLTCTGVSFAHGSNDGQKGVGLIMLILIGLLPAHYALNPRYDAAQVNQTVATIQQVESILDQSGAGGSAGAAHGTLERIKAALAGKADLKSIPSEGRIGLRNDVLQADEELSAFEKEQGVFLSEADRKALKAAREQLRGAVDFIVPWVAVAVALALGVGTTVGWKRIVVTVGEKIGKTHLTYAQGAAAEIVAMTTIAA